MYYTAAVKPIREQKQKRV